MAVNLPLQDMTVAEKLQIMEAIWEDLSRNSEALDSPGWHEDVLRLRQENVAKGQGQFRDWESAKADLRRQLG